jgi:hypothetical protein
VDANWLYLEARGIPADAISGDVSQGRLSALEDRIMARENQRARRLKSFAVTLQRLAAAPQVGPRTSHVAIAHHVIKRI